MVNLDEAIRAAWDAVKATPQDHPDRAAFLNNLGVRLGNRYSRTGAMADLEEAIRVARDALDATPQDHPDRVARLNNLGAYLRNRYLRTGAMADLEEAIRAGRDAVEATPKDHLDRAGLLSNLGVSLGHRYSRTGAMADLEEAIRVARDAVEATPQNHPNRAGRLNNLGIRLGDRYLRTGAMTDLEESIRATHDALEATPQDHPDRAGWLNNLGTYLGDRYLRTGAMADLEEAIQAGRDAVEATPKDHPDRAALLDNLGVSLGDRYSRTGAMADLEEAIRVARDALESTPQDHPDWVVRLNNLGAYLRNRYLRTGAMADLEEAIRATRDALKATPQDHPNRAKWLNNLGAYLGNRYSRTRAMADLEEAIQATRGALEATPHDHPDRAGWLNNLGNRLGDRYSRTGAMTDLEEAIRIARDALDATPRDHPDRAGRLNNLGIRLGDRYLRTGAMADLEEAIRATRDAVDATLQGHPARAGRLNNLGIRLGDRYSRTGATADLEEAKACFTRALRHTASTISTRVNAGRHFLSSPFVLEDPQACAIAETTVDLVPLLSVRTLQNTDKRHLLSAAVGLASDAAAIALHANQGSIKAINLLETGRGVIAGALFEQSDVSALQSTHPELARCFVDLRDQLDAPAPATSFNTADRPMVAVEAEGHQRSGAKEKLDALLKTIRSKRGFERFLLPASEDEMLDAARYGSIVVLNVSSYRCDALIIEQSGIRSLELPRLSLQAINEHVQDLGSIETLGWLWDVIVCPVLNSLGFTGLPLNGPWPHVWWVPTGPLTRFPLHAAGHHLQRNGETALDRVVSSYASSIKAIIYSRRRPVVGTGQSPNVVAVGLKTTPEQAPLYFATDEVEAVLAVCESMGMRRVPAQPYKYDVSAALEACSIFHFAGHGDTHPTEPLYSRLLLEDWKQDPFTVASLLETNFTSKAPFLAYLSACGTGQILDGKSVDESIHLANAFQLAGFRHVIGTLWGVDDELCVDMARMTYEYLRDEGMRDESVGGGHHRASRMLRDRWVDGEIKAGCGEGRSGAERRVVLGGVSDRTQPLWVPYVHFGL